MIPLSAGWSDVGAWDALWQVLPKDADGNVSQGDVILQDSLGDPSRAIAAFGLKLTSLHKIWK